MIDSKKRYLNQDAADVALKNSINEATIRKAREYRLKRTRQVLRDNDIAAVLLYDPCNIRYATDTSNMQLWTMHNLSRYCLIFADGPVILFDYHNCAHMHDEKRLPNGQLTVDEIRPAIVWAYFAAGERAPEQAMRWGADIASLMQQYGGGNKRLAVDICEQLGIAQLHKHGIETLSGMKYMEHARGIKSAEELQLMQWTITVCQKGMERMWDHCEPGISENELWAHLHFENIRNGGEWIETRILCAGERTNPWMQESSDAIIQKGDIVSFDTDLIGPYGYCADISRAWIAGHEKPTAIQQEIYDIAIEHITYNMGLLKDGLAFHDFVDRSWKLPERFAPNRYSCSVHGVGLADEYPCIYHPQDHNKVGYNGHFQENMVVCVESYTGGIGEKEGVKLEQQVRITKTGVELLSDFAIGSFN